ncbi:MAG: hypothetical protein COX82_01525 [Candidatus Magasanikbacteria bacterium CG_4_10_14_0_2_um_filter_41_10]|nr:MAG: hypothetical protein COX82_01525 [Candidatus Magasanikbacteria bacterium CG_4_10_14_0_2_um_filter_41_10]
MKKSAAWLVLIRQIQKMAPDLGLSSFPFVVGKKIELMLDALGEIEISLYGVRQTLLELSTLKATCPQFVILPFLKDALERLVELLHNYQIQLEKEAREDP